MCEISMVVYYCNSVALVNTLVGISFYIVLE
jgi:hypothetical protein